ncbi:MAG TPA: N,N-dimethylformamidase beta subunit family domain-containing protein, partial [Thermoanaerobaculia bacterium]|nr:N,N-dimethylformamidase beta subunit family domain-containing protein [Thermoanaerobaculia bacterium]
MRKIALLFATLLATTPLIAQRHRAVLPFDPRAPEPETHSFAEGGYASATSVVQGGYIVFYMSNAINPFTVTVVNLANPDVTMTTLPNLAAPVSDCTGNWQNGCGWQATQTLYIPTNWPSGYYDARFSTSIGPKHIIFVVKAANPGSTSPILVVQPTNTYQAYNAYGGKSTYPTDSPDRATTLSFDRPYDDQNGLGEFRLWEMPFVNWMTSEGRKFEVATDSDLEDPTLLSHYKLVVFVGHDEYWTATARQNIEAFSRNGGHIAMFSGNNMWYQVRLTNSGRTLVAYKDATTDPITASTPALATTNWYDWPVYDPENSVLGLSYRSGGYANKVDAPDVFLTKPLDQRIGYTVADPNNWIFQNTNVTAGSTFGAGASGLEVDGTRYNCSANDPLNMTVDGSDGTPLNFHIVATTPSDYGHGVIGTYTNSAGGTVFNAGTRDWAQVLGTDPVVTQITRNVLDRLGTGQPQPYDPVTTNVKTADTFNCPQPANAPLPGWRGTIGEAKLTSSCAHEGAAGLQVSGVDGLQVARNFAPTNSGVGSVQASAYINADAVTGPLNAPFTLFALQNRQMPSGTNQRLVVVEMNITSAGKQLRLVQQASDNSVEARSAFVDLPAGWTKVQLSWTSPGTVSLQVGNATPITLNNVHPNET